MAKQMICTACGYCGNSKKVTKGSFAVELVLWLLLLIPGIIYSIWRLSSKYQACPQCGSANMIPVDSPNGRELLYKSAKAKQPAKRADPYDDWVKNNSES